MDSGAQAADAAVQWDDAWEQGASRQPDDPRAGIDEAVAGLDRLAELPVSEHVQRFEAVHTELTTALSSIDKV